MSVQNDNSRFYDALTHSDDDYEDFSDTEDGYVNMTSPISKETANYEASRNFTKENVKERLETNIFLVIYLLLAVASLTIGLILEIDSKLLANSNYRNYLDTNKFVLYIFIAYQVIVILTLVILLYINNTSDSKSFIKKEILLSVSSAFFIINTILFTLEIFNGRGNFPYNQDYILLLLSVGALLYCIFVIYGMATVF
jgi:hypothetical protein